MGHYSYHHLFGFWLSKFFVFLFVWFFQVGLAKKSYQHCNMRAESLLTCHHMYLIAFIYKNINSCVQLVSTTLFHLRYKKKYSGHIFSFFSYVLKCPIKLVLSHFISVVTQKTQELWKTIWSYSLNYGRMSTIAINSLLS